MTLGSNLSVQDAQNERINELFVTTPGCDQADWLKTEGAPQITHTASDRCPSKPVPANPRAAMWPGLVLLARARSCMPSDDAVVVSGISF